MSESQERMCAVVEPEKVDRFLEICEKWDVIATVIGEVTDGDRLEIFWHGEQDRRRRPAHRRARGPGLRAPVRPPDWQDALQADDAEQAAPARRRPRSCGTRSCSWSPRPNQASKSWITDQYDRFVQGNTVLAQPEDAGMIRIDEETGLGVAIATDGNGRYAKLDPYTGAQLALAEAYRNVADDRRQAARRLRLPELRLARGPGRHVAVRRGHPRPRRRLPGSWAPRSPAATSRSTTRPATPPSTRPRWSPCSASSTTSPAARRSPSRSEGQLLYLLGDTREEFGGSAWSQVVHDHLGGLPPKVDLERERLLGEILIAASRDGMIDAAHDLSDGGLVQAVVESCLRGGNGARLVVPDGPRRRSPSCSPSRRAARSSPSRAARSSASPTCAARAACPRRGSASSTATRSRCRASSASPLAELRDGARGDDPGAAGLSTSAFGGGPFFGPAPSFVPTPPVAHTPRPHPRAHVPRPGTALPADTVVDRPLATA